jgi:hypothetical protein
MTAPQEKRPRIVTAAFWCWLGASVLLAALGLVLALDQTRIPLFLRGAGALFVVAGLGLGFLAGRARTGDTRFRRAAVGLALALVIVLALFVVLSHGVLWVLPMILTLAGAILVTRPSAQEWFPSEASP